MRNVITSKSNKPLQQSFSNWFFEENTDNSKCDKLRFVESVYDYYVTILALKVEGD